MTIDKESKPRRGIPVWIFFAALVCCALVTFGLAALLVNIFQRKQEAKNPFVRLVDVDNNTSDPERWRMNWPREYDGYSRTSGDDAHGLWRQRGARADDITRWKPSHGSAPVRGLRVRDRFPRAAQARTCCMTRESTKRVLEKPQPGACLNCHASIVPTYRRVGLEKRGKDAGGCRRI